MSSKQQPVPNGTEIDTLELQTYHHVLARLSSRRADTVNDIRTVLGRLEAPGEADTTALRLSLVRRIGKNQDRMSPGLALAAGLYEDWLWFDERIDALKLAIARLEHHGSRA